MPKLHIEISEEIEEAIQERRDRTGQTKSEVTRTALVNYLDEFL